MRNAKAFRGGATTNAPPYNGTDLLNLQNVPVERFGQSNFPVLLYNLHKPNIFFDRLRDGEPISGRGTRPLHYDNIAIAVNFRAKGYLKIELLLNIKPIFKEQIDHSAVAFAAVGYAADPECCIDRLI